MNVLKNIFPENFCNLITFRGEKKKKKSESGDQGLVNLGRYFVLYQRMIGGFLVTGCLCV